MNINYNDINFRNFVEQHAKNGYPVESHYRFAVNFDQNWTALEGCPVTFDWENFVYRLVK